MSRSQEDLEINDLSTKCSVLAEGLLAELKTLRLEQSGFRHAIKKSFHVFKHNGSLKEKQALLEKYQHVLDTRILLRLDSRSLKETQSFDTLDQDVRSLATALEQGYRTFARLIADQGQDLKEHIDKGFEKQAQAKAEGLAHQQLLESLFFPEIVSRQEQISEAFKGTYQWIFDSPSSKRVTNVRWSNFHDWLETSDGIYWISGKPGSGKSTLMKFIVHANQTLQLLETWKKDGRLLMISFFFWRPGSDLQKSVTGLLRSLLYQIASQWPDFTNHIEVQDRNATGEVNVPINLRHLAAWTDQRLLRVLKCFLDRKPTSLRICALIDGLDEFIGEEELLLDVVRIFGEAPQCKVCVSSRPEQAFRQEFRMCSQLKVQDLNHEDIEKTVAGKLSPHLEKYTSPEAKRSALESAIVWKAEGVFLWLDLMIKILIRGAKNGDSYETLLSRLNKTPDTINGLYTHIWESLDSVYKEEGLKYFHTLLAANELRTAMSLAELVCAEGEPRERVIQFDREYFVSEQFKSACQHVETRLIACCGGLLEVQGYSSFEKGVDEELQDEELEDGELEDEKWKNEDSRDKGFEEGESNDEMVKKVDLEIPVTIPYYDIKVDFVHRTAFDFVRDQCKGPHYYKSSSYQNASIRVSIGKISQLVFTSLIFTRDELYKSTDLAQIFKSIMRSICWTEYLYFDATDTADERSKSLQTDLTHQAFQSLQQLYTFFHQTEQSPFSNFPFVRRLILTGNDMKDGDSSFMCWCPISDGLSAAAYFGCYNYTRFRLLPPNNFNGAVSTLLQCVISGTKLDTFDDISLSRRKIKPRLLIIQMLLQHNFDPNALLATPTFGISWMTVIYGGTLWGGIFCVMMMSYVDLRRSLTSDSERFTWQSYIADIVEKFLDLGANPNARIITSSDTFAGNQLSTILLEASPLALIDIASIDNASFFTGIQAKLVSAGAVNYRKPLYISIGHYSRPDSIMFYHLSKVRSEKLDPVITSLQVHMYRVDSSRHGLYLDENAQQILEDIKNSFSNEDAIDGQAMQNEIESLPLSF